MPTNIFDMTDTWNAGGVVFNGIKLTVNTAAYAAGSRLLDLQTGSGTQFAVDPVNGATIGAPTGGMKGPGTLNATAFYINGTLFDPTVFQPLDTQLTAFAALAGGVDQLPYFTATFTMAQTTLTAFARTLLDDVDAVTMRTTLGVSSFAPIGSEYITSVSDATLTAERVLTDTATITWDRSTAGQIKATSVAGGGNVSTSGSPTVGQYGKWVTGTTIQGVAVGTVLTDIGAQPLDAGLTALAVFNSNGLLVQTANDTFVARALTPPANGFSITNPGGSLGNPTFTLTNDLAALEGLAGTNNIYYRSAADTWTAVTIGTGLSFTAGTLAATAGAKVGFSAYETVDQNCANGANVKIVFTSTVFNDSALFSTSTYRWTPPAGRCHLMGAVNFQNCTLGSTINLMIWKNGSSFKNSTAAANTGTTDGAHISVIDTCNGTDFYELYVNTVTSVGSTIATGSQSLKWFMGTTL